MNQVRHALPTGHILMDYRLERILGAGGFGITYLATDGNLKRHFAIKEYFPFNLTTREGTIVAPLPDAAEEYERGLRDFILEAQTLARFHHPNIVSVARIFEANNTAYMVLDYEQGESFKEWLRESHSRIQQMEIDTIAARLLDALERVHADGTLHRDIAPDNIFIRDGDGSPVLLDFGAARQALHARSRSVSAIVKPGYSPQEQYSSQTDRQGPWTDIYSLGATLYRAISGFVPQDASDRVLEDTLEPLSGMNLKGYRPTFLAAIDWALELSPRDRPQSVAEWRPVLLGTAPAPAKSPSHVIASAPRSRWRMGLIAVVLLGMLTASAGATAYYFRQRISLLLQSTEQDLAQSNKAMEQARASSVETRKQISDLESGRDAEIDSLSGSIEASQGRINRLEQQLRQTQGEALNRSMAEQHDYQEKASELRNQITEEQARATQLEAEQAKARNTLNERIRQLEARLRQEEAETERAVREADTLRRKSDSESRQFAGIELAVVGPPGDYLVRGVAPTSAFNTAVSKGDTVRSISINGAAIPVSDKEALSAAERGLDACDLFVAEVVSGSASRSVTIRLPQDFAASSPTSPRVLGDLGLTVGTPPRPVSMLGAGRGRIVIISVSDGSIGQKAGLKSGDLILQIAGTSGVTIAELEWQITTQRATGGTINLSVLRNCATQSIAVHFANPVQKPRWFGLSLSTGSGGGVRVDDIANSSPFFGGGLSIGDEVVRVTDSTRTFDVTDPASFVRATTENLCGKVTLTIIGNGRWGRTLQIDPEMGRAPRTFRLATLGLDLAEARDGVRFQVRSIDNAHDAIEATGIRVDDMLRSIGTRTGRGIGLMTDQEQKLVIANGASIAIERGCMPMRLEIPPQFTRYINYDLVGETFNTLDVSDSSACEAACSDDNSCHAYTFDAWNRKCYLKNSFSTLQLNARSTSGTIRGMPAPIRSGATVVFEYFNKKGFPGTGFVLRYSESREQCQAICSDYERCIAFNFRSSVSQCELFDQVGEYFTEPGTRAGAKRQN
ncbi:protein kinase domain-containing protein [Sinorhizobium fredii]|uniref:protein kinase domain-containing protein n=1 Tax=Rhizobium fredii TaxID=380 RepID=UPI00351773FC